MMNEMKMKKDNRMFLAIVIVAALAMVSIAGVAMSDSSDAGSVYTFGDVEITSNTTDSIDIKDAMAGTYGDSRVSIAADANYTGTLQYGKYTAATATSAASYVPYVTLNVTGVSGVIIYFDSLNNDYDYDVYAYTISPNGTEVTTGTIEVVKGDVAFGAGGSYFTGTVNAKSAAMEAVNILGLEVKAGTAGTISGNIAAGGQVDSKNKAVDSTVTVSGTAYMAGTGIGADVEFIIADDAIVTSASDIASYSVTLNTSYTGALAVANVTVTKASGTGTPVASIVGEGAAAKKIVVSGIGLGSVVTVVAYTPTDGNIIYSGTITTYYDGSYDLVSSIVVGDIVQKVPTEANPIGFDGATDYTITFDSTKYTYVAAYNMTDAASLATTPATGKIAFLTSGHELADEDKVLIVLKKTADNKPFYYLGAVTVVDNDVTNLAASSSMKVLAAATAAGAASATTPISFDGTTTYSVSYYSTDYTYKAAFNLVDDASLATTPATGTISFLTGSHELATSDIIFAIFTDDDGALYYYSGSATVDATTNCVTALTAVAPTVIVAPGTNYVLTTIDMGTITTITFPAAKGAVVDSTGTLAITTVPGEAITSVPISLEYTVTGTAYTFEGKVTVTNGVGSIVPNSIPNVKAGTLGIVLAATTDIGVAVDGLFKVNGSLTMTYSATPAAACTITNNGTIDVNGMITYTTVKDGAAITAPTSTTSLLAACYSSTNTNANTTTYNYTTLDNAMTASDNITILGKIVIDAATYELTGNSSAATIENTITLGQYGLLEVGIEAQPAAKTPVVGVTSIVTVPQTTKLVFVVGGLISVENGQLIWYTAAEPTDNAGVVADVLMTETMTGGYSAIYTDLATALGIATSGNTVTVRAGITAATFSDNTELKADVILDADNVVITINAGATFTVNGELNAAKLVINKATTTLGAGNVILNNKVFALPEIDLAGIVTFGAAFDNTAATATDIATAIEYAGTTEKVPAIIKVVGALDYAGSITEDAAGAYLAIEVTGTLNLTGAAAQLNGVNESIYVAGVFTHDANETVLNATIFNGGEQAPGAAAITFTVNGAAVIGGTSTITAAIDVTATITLGANASIVMYGESENVTILPATVQDLTLYSDNAVYSIAYIQTGSTMTFGNAGYVAPSKDGYTFMGWYYDPAFVELYAVNLKNVAINTVLNGTNATDTLYAKYNVETVSVTVDTPVGGIVKINGATYDGISAIPWASSYSITVDAQRGYNASDAKILINGNAVSSATQLKSGDLITVDGMKTDNTVQEESQITEYLLIILTIVVVIIAIVVIMKMMRS